MPGERFASGFWTVTSRGTSLSRLGGVEVWNDHLDARRILNSVCFRYVAVLEMAVIWLLMIMCGLVWFSLVAWCV